MASKWECPATLAPQDGTVESQAGGAICKGRTIQKILVGGGFKEQRCNAEAIWKHKASVTWVSGMSQRERQLATSPPL